VSERLTTTLLLPTLDEIEAVRVIVRSCARSGSTRSQIDLRLGRGKDGDAPPALITHADGARLW
jgi:hypothetical protein